MPAVGFAWVNNSFGHAVPHCIIFDYKPMASKPSIRAVNNAIGRELTGVQDFHFVILLYFCWIDFCLRCCSCVGASPRYLQVWSFLRTVIAKRFQDVTMLLWHGKSSK